MILAVLLIIVFLGTVHRTRGRIPHSALATQICRTQLTHVYIVYKRTPRWRKTTSRDDVCAGTEPALSVTPLSHAIVDRSAKS